MRRRVLGRTHQNNDIVCGDRSHLMRIFVHDRVFTKHFLNALSNILCFDIDLGRTAGLRSVIVRGALSCDIFHVDRYEFYCVARDLFILWEIGSAGSQCFLFVVVDTANYRAHAAMHDVIGCFEDFRARTKVLAEKNLARLPFSCLCVILVGVVMRQEDRRVGQTETVNALLNIAYHEAVAAGADCFKDSFLYTVAVLILIDHNFAIVLADIGSNFCTFVGLRVKQ